VRVALSLPRPSWRSLAVGAGLLVLSGLLVMRTGAQEAEVRMTFIGDGGTGDANQAAVRDQILRFLPRYLFLLGDNIYSDGRGSYIRPRFYVVYQSLLLRGVLIHSALGNHDVQECEGSDADPLPATAEAYRAGQRGCDVAQHLGHAPFGYQGQRRYYSVASDTGPSPLVEVFVLDSNTLAGTQSKVPRRADRAQIEWLDRALGASRARWKILAMHHPPHSPTAKNGFLGFGDGRVPEVALKNQLEPLLARHSVDAVFAAHNHFYARMIPQNGVRYFVSGGGGRRVYGFQPAPGYLATGGGFLHFLYVRITRDRFEYYAVDSRGRSRDAGWFGKGDQADRQLPPQALPPPTAAQAAQ
jgi:hypothetical protein